MASQALSARKANGDLYVQAERIAVSVARSTSTSPWMRC